jgi:hypothetical protein
MTARPEFPEPSRNLARRLGPPVSEAQSFAEPLGFGPGFEGLTGCERSLAGAGERCPRSFAKHKPRKTDSRRRTMSTKS